MFGVIIWTRRGEANKARLPQNLETALARRRRGPELSTSAFVPGACFYQHHTLTTTILPSTHNNTSYHITLTELHHGKRHSFAIHVAIVLPLHLILKLLHLSSKSSKKDLANKHLLHHSQ